MIKHALVISLSLVCFDLGSARADAKSDAQAKVDAAKTEVCEKGKKFLADQEAKGRCASESAEAKKITCSASTSKQVIELQNKCIKSASSKSDDKAAPAAGGTKCRALDINDSAKVIAEADDKASTKCAGLLVAGVKKALCSPANKGKKVEYMTDYDHTLVKGQKLKGRKTSTTCR